MVERHREGGRMTSAELRLVVCRWEAERMTSTEPRLAERREGGRMTSMEPILAERREGGRMMSMEPMLEERREGGRMTSEAAECRQSGMEKRFLNLGERVPAWAG